ncbi:hypothetical protein HAX54_035164 [Datura stramonium]|uniref:Disease resistance protein winged helix domain-containing protein n=1 Tax=Datura stramonium TaxID=4076 RepID=A0ABS8VG68_DATST|nr:hypothetical protein [Datura stramonium]
MHHTNPYSLRFLTPDESLKLLQKRVFQQERCPPGLYDASQAVAKRCKRFPLVIILVAGIIKRKKTEESWWHEVKNALFSYLGESEEYSLSTMQLNYDYLPEHLRPCLLYMGMFPEDARIHVSKLISLWIAEGFVQNIIESGRLEETAEDYLMDLISNNVVLVSKRKYNGKVKYCQVHDVLLHFCSEKSREEKFMQAVNRNFSHFPSPHWKESRVIFSSSDELSEFSPRGSKTRKPFRQHLRSLTITNIQEEFYRWNLFLLCSKLILLKSLDDLLRMCPNLQELEIEFQDYEYRSPMDVLLESLTQLQILSLSIYWTPYVPNLSLPSTLKKLVLRKFITESTISAIGGLPNLEYLELHIELREWFSQLRDITFHKLKFLELSYLDISRWDVSEESFPSLKHLL